MTTAPTVDELKRQTLLAERDKARLELEEVRQRVEQQKAASAEKHEPPVSAEEARAAARKKTIQENRAQALADLKDVETSIASLKGATLTLPEKTVFREALVAQAAMLGAAGALAAAVGAKAGGGPVVVTGRIDQAESALAALSFRAAVIDSITQAERVLAVDVAAVAASAAGEEGIETKAGESGEAPAEPAAETPGSVIGAVVSFGVAALNALTVETSIEATAREASELETHVAVITALLTVQPAVTIRHDAIGLPDANSPLLADFSRLQASLPLLDAKAEEWQQAIGDRDPDDDAHKPVIAALQRGKAEVVAVATRITEFVKSANTADAAGLTALRVALRAYALLGAGAGGDVRYVAVVRPARIAAHQVALKRRLFAPRLVISASATIDLILLDVTSRAIAAAGSFVDEAALHVRFPMTWWGSDAQLAPTYKVLKGSFTP